LVHGEAKRSHKQHLPALSYKIHPAAPTNFVGVSFVSAFFFPFFPSDQLLPELCHTTMNHTTSKEVEQQEEEVGSIEIAACSICHCSMDYSDLATFDPTDRYSDYQKNNDDDDYFFRKSDPYLPKSLYDPENALVYCDTCPRLFHRHCHFVPLLSFHVQKPWSCLICQVSKTWKKNKKKKPSYVVDDLFRSPPVPNMTSYQLAWDHNIDVQQCKLQSLLQQLHAAYPRTAIASYKHAKMALELWGSTTSSSALKKGTITARQNPKNAVGQEVIQNLVRLAHSKQKIRRTIQNLERIRSTRMQRESWHELQTWIQQQQRQQDSYAATTTTTTTTKKKKAANYNVDEFVQRVLFPFGQQYERRWYPVSPEYNQAATTTTTTTVANNNHKHKKNQQAQNKNKKNHKKNHDEDSFSVDGLACCMCFGNESTDENDLILCDGENCFRVYHTQCLTVQSKQHFHKTANKKNNRGKQQQQQRSDHHSIHKKYINNLLPTKNEEEDDWFCPLCRTLSDWLVRIRADCHGDDDEEENEEEWDTVQDVFPEAEWEYETSMAYKAGNRNADTIKLLAEWLDHPADPNKGEDNVDDEDDDDDLEVDGLFDLDSYNKERQLEREQDSDHDDSTHSSQATLAEMSSIELDIDSDELDALQKERELTDDENRYEHPSQSSDNCDVQNRVRRSRRRRRHCRACSDNGISSASSRGGQPKGDLGKLDVGNIVPGKRQRRIVDYRKLNDVIFGALSEREVAKLDGGEDFVISFTKKSKFSSSKSSSSISSGADDSDLDDDKNEEAIKQNHQSGKGRRASRTNCKVSDRRTSARKRRK
jgi:hypothetical protein